MDYSKFLTTENSIALSEAMSTFKNAADNVIDTIQTGIQPDNSDAEVNRAFMGRDPLARLLVNNAVANAATIQVDPCVNGDYKWFIQTPYTLNDSGLENINDDGVSCCVTFPEIGGCRYKLGINQLCVKDCVSTVLDEMMEERVKIKEGDTDMPFRVAGDSLKKARAKFLALYAPFIFERNAILGTPTFSGNALRPFDGLVSRLSDNRTLAISGKAGFLTAIETMDCRARAMGLDLGRFVCAVNRILMPTLRQEIHTYLKTDPFTDWRIDDRGNISYRGLRFVESKYVDVDLENNTTSAWLIDPASVGIKMLYSLENPLVKQHESEDDCGGHCVTMHNAGSTVVKNWNGLAIVTDIKLSSICDSSALSGLENYVNAGVNGYMFPKVQ